MQNKKARKLPKTKITEADVTRWIRHFLQINGIFHFKNWGGPMSYKGVSDIVGVLPDGRFLAIEVKRPGGNLTKHQKTFLNNINLNNGVAFKAESVKDVIDNLTLHNIDLRLWIN